MYSEDYSEYKKMKTSKLTQQVLSDLTPVAEWRPGMLVGGAEVPDQRPIAVPLKYSAPESLPDMVQRFTRANLDQQGLHDVESFEEADDFELDDGFDHTSPYEDRFDPTHAGTKAMEARAGFRGPVSPAEAQRRAAKIAADEKVALAKKAAESQGADVLAAVRELVAELRARQAPAK